MPHVTFKFKHKIHTPAYVKNITKIINRFIISFIINPSILSAMAKPAKRQFATVDHSTIEELTAKRYSENTMRSYNHSLSILKQFYDEKWPERDIDKLNASEWNSLLEEFYPSIRKMNGEKAKKNTYDSIRAAVTKHLKEKYTININSPHFNSSNMVYQGLMKVLKTEGLACVAHYKKINNDDFAKIVPTLSINDPQELQWLLWFFIQVFFCRRGNENVTNMKINTFSVSVMQNKRYIHQTVDEMTKNNRIDDEPAIGGRLYENTDSEKCPVKIYLKYLSLLNPKCDRLWQLPKHNNQDITWYHNVPLGHNKLMCFMKNISERCHLSTIYTNHSLRVTAISTLGDKFSETEIASISGHKSLQSLSIYKRISEAKKQQMSETLASACCIPKTQQIQYGNASITDNICNDMLGEKENLSILEDCMQSERHIDFNKKPEEGVSATDNLPKSSLSKLKLRKIAGEPSKNNWTVVKSADADLNRVQSVSKQRMLDNFKISNHNSISHFNCDIETNDFDRYAQFMPTFNYCGSVNISINHNK